MPHSKFTLVYQTSNDRGSIFINLMKLRNSQVGSVTGDGSWLTDNYKGLTENTHTYNTHKHTRREMDTSGTELVIYSIMNCASAVVMPIDVAYVILSYDLSSLDKSDITNVK